VISRGRAVVSAALQLGIESGRIRPVDVDSTVQVLMAPLLLLSVWRTSFSVCDAEACRPENYLPTYFDLIMNGLLCQPESGDGS